MAGRKPPTPTNADFPQVDDIKGLLNNPNDGNVISNPLWEKQITELTSEW